MEKLPDILHPSWHQYLQPLFDDRKMIMIKDQILPKAKFYPDKSDIFRVFAMPLSKIKVVILGQDPYPNGEAIGLSFAVHRSTKIPGSLNVIRNEIINSKVERDSKINIDTPPWRELHHWTQQGIFLLNTSLTVEAKHAGSHEGYWKWFTTEVVKIISREITPVWLLWGSKAKAYKSIISMPWNGIRPKSEVDAGYKPDKDIIKEMNIYLEADHPAAELYPGSKYKFSGCNHFNLCNKLLKETGENIINW